MSNMVFCMYILFIMHICIVLYIHVTVLYYILASFQKINVNVNINPLLARFGMVKSLNFAVFLIESVSS